MERERLFSDVCSESRQAYNGSDSLSWAEPAVGSK